MTESKPLMSCGQRTGQPGQVRRGPRRRLRWHRDALCFGRTDRAVLAAYADGLHAIDQWLRSLGGNTTPFDPPPGRLPAPFPSWPHFPAGQTIRYRTIAGGTGRRGEALWDLLDAAVRARGIPVRFGTAAERLLLADDGSVTGLAVSDGGRPVTLGANRRDRVRPDSGRAGGTWLSPGALIGLARTLAAGLGADGIAVTCVAPGLTATATAQRDRSAAALTGQTLCTDGGLVMR